MGSISVDGGRHQVTTASTGSLRASIEAFRLSRTLMLSSLMVLASPISRGVVRRRASDRAGPAVELRAAVPSGRCRPRSSREP